ncbi:NmrA family NAD(P)-binding protein [Acidicapsa ligni]|uniref:NmrA family NAD(P)-binding protein n=1 Tax=Acidicapsa ligni TaxID=542300 RepID=UPI0021E073C5|nr:NmrA family NAD(P)-binding protein [Acidicapsa ligni]
MFAITGITGKVGGHAARALLAAGKQVRAVVRDEGKGKQWLEQGCEITTADMNDIAGLTRAFSGAEGVFILFPPVYDPEPGFDDFRAKIKTVYDALVAAKPGKVVVLSTIGSKAPHANLLNILGVMEDTLATLPLPVTFLRAAWFMENSSWDVASARDEGVVRSFLQPLDKTFPMIATVDIGKLAAKLLQEEWSGIRTVELESAHRITPNEISATFAKVLGREVRSEVVPRETWEPLFRSQGMQNPTPRIRMIDGFNEGWIEFDGGQANSRKGETSLESVLRSLVLE